MKLKRFYNRETIEKQVLNLKIKNISFISPFPHMQLKKLTLSLNSRISANHDKGEGLLANSKYI